MIHLDTNALIGLEHPDARFRVLLDSVKAGAQLGTSAVAWHEFMCGPYSPLAPPRLRSVVAGRILPLTEDIAELAAYLYNRTGRRRGSNADCLIAATAIEHEAALFTLDAADFKPFTAFGLRILGAG